MQTDSSLSQGAATTAPHGHLQNKWHLCVPPSSPARPDQLAQLRSCWPRSSTAAPASLQPHLGHCSLGLAAGCWGGGREMGRSWSSCTPPVLSEWCQAFRYAIHPRALSNYVFWQSRGCGSCGGRTVLAGRAGASRTPPAGCCRPAVPGTGAKHKEAGDELGGFSTHINPRGSSRADPRCCCTPQPPVTRGDGVWGALGCWPRTSAGHRA